MPMSMNAANMTTNWGENIQGAEQATLSDFASQLEAHVSLDGTKIEKKDVDIREEAEILLSLLSAIPPTQSQSIDDDEYAYSSDYQDLIRRDPSFSFTIPLMSLEECCSKRQDSTAQESSDGSTTTEDSTVLPVATLAPAVLLGRQLVGNGSSVEADKYGETMARNMAESFQKAVEWRIQVWIRSLSSILVKREKALTEAHASDDIIHELLDTPEAQVLLCLQKAASDISVVDTKTNLRVLFQRINRSQEHGLQGGCSSLKKRKLEDLDSLQTESEYRYSVAHMLSFESTINLKTPAGYTEVTIEAPGIIEGSFLSSDSGEDTLTRISVEVDTNVIAMAIERSSRVVARTATHAVIPTTEEESEDEEEENYPKEQTEELAPSPTLNAQTGPYDEATKAVLVTPHKTTSSTMYEVNDVSAPSLPDDLNNVAKEVVRMVSPQPRTPEYLSFNFTPRTPHTTRDKTDAEDMLNLVSPPPPAPVVSPPTPSSSKTSSEDEGSPSISARKSPSLPALLQVASAAMEAC